MGSQSFGKGSVQTVAKIDDTQGIKLTIAQYMTPQGRKIQAIGIKPDVEVAEAEGDWLKENEKSGKYIREVDLRNHLTATIETAEEKKVREEREYKERMERVAHYKKMKESQKKKETKEDIYKKYDPNEDYQVLQAVNYLRSFKVFKKMLQ